MSTSADTDALVREHLPIAKDAARAAANRYRWLPGESFDTFYSDALLGLYHGLSTYDPARGSLESHLRFRARMEIWERLRSGPRQVPVVDEGLPEQVPDEQGEDRLLDVEARVDRPRERARLEALLDRVLTDRQAHLVREHYLRGRTQLDLAREDGVTPAAVNHSLTAALRRLRAALMGEPVRPPRRGRSAVLA
jgi:RNA polymerase sigma factor (sigma-70 family)